MSIGKESDDEFLCNSSGRSRSGQPSVGEREPRALQGESQTSSRARDGGRSASVLSASVADSSLLAGGGRSAFASRTCFLALLDSAAAQCRRCALFYLKPGAASQISNPFINFASAVSFRFRFLPDVVHKLCPALG